MSVSNFKNMGLKYNFKGFDSFEFLKLEISVRDERLGEDV